MSAIGIAHRIAFRLNTRCGQSIDSGETPEELNRAVLIHLQNLQSQLQEIKEAYTEVDPESDGTIKQYDDGIEALDEAARAIREGY